jgi:hypothetical protein
MQAVREESKAIVKATCLLVSLTVFLVRLFSVMPEVPLPHGLSIGAMAFGLFIIPALIAAIGWRFCLSLSAWGVSQSAILGVTVFLAVVSGGRLPDRLFFHGAVLVDFGFISYLCHRCIADTVGFPTSMHVHKKYQLI